MTTIIDVLARVDQLFGLFFTLFLLLAKFPPVVNIAEVKAILKSSSVTLPVPASGVDRKRLVV